MHRAIVIAVVELGLWFVGLGAQVFVGDRDREDRVVCEADGEVLGGGVVAVAARKGFQGGVFVLGHPECCYFRFQKYEQYRDDKRDV